MVFDKMVSIFLDFKWSGFPISDTSRNLDHLQTILFLNISKKSRLVRISDPQWTGYFIQHSNGKSIWNTWHSDPVFQELLKNWIENAQINNKLDPSARHLYALTVWIPFTLKVYYSHESGFQVSSICIISVIRLTSFRVCFDEFCKHAHPRLRVVCGHRNDIVQL